jgi:hypothetical protein
LTTNESAPELTRFWLGAWTLVALVSVFAFLQDIIAADWPAWVFSPLLILAFRAAVTAAPRNGILRSALNLAALLMVPFMALFALIDEAFYADWPEWVLAPAIVIGVWMVISTIVEAEAD